MPHIQRIFSHSQKSGSVSTQDITKFTAQFLAKNFLMIIIQILEASLFILFSDPLFIMNSRYFGRDTSIPNKFCKQLFLACAEKILTSKCYVFVLFFFSQYIMPAVKACWQAQGNSLTRRKKEDTGNTTAQ